MTKLMHIQTSPGDGHSASQAVAERFIEAYRAAHPDDAVDTLDLWQVELPEFNNASIGARYAVMHGQSHSPEQHKIWQAVERTVDQFKSADKYLVSLPMWNFGIPYKLKHYIDILVQPGLTFSFTPEEGYKGLVTDKPLVAIYARGGVYGPGSGAEGYDLQSPYLKQIFRFIGISDFREIFVEPTGSPASKGEVVAAASRRAIEMAAQF